LALLIGVAAALPLAAAPAIAEPVTPSVQGVKPLPAPPADAYRPGNGPRVVAKPKKAATMRAGSALAPWSVSLTATASTPWPLQYSTLTATTNQDLGPTSYYVSIYENDAGAPVAVCGVGKTCSVSLTKNTPTHMPYGAIVTNGYPGVYPPSGEVAWARQSVHWRGTTVNLTASATTTPVNGSVTLTATTSDDISSSPFWTEIYDATTGARLNFCGGGRVCTASTGQSAATTHRFVAVEGRMGDTLPPPNAQESSPPAWVTWTAPNWTVSLATTSSQGVIATASADVGPSPYYIEIFAESDRSDGTVAGSERIASCASGTTCTVPYPPAGAWLVAYVASISTALPPANTQASSTVIPSPTIIS
jgi:hypothetical protein